MPNKYYQRKHVTDIKIFLKKQKDKKRPKKDIKTLMKKEKKSVNIIVNVIKVFRKSKTKC